MKVKIGDEYWIFLARDGDQWRTLVYAAINLGCSKIRGVS
jgi:hypothetical protein